MIFYKKWKLITLINGLGQVRYTVKHRFMLFWFIPLWFHDTDGYTESVLYFTTLTSALEHITKAYHCELKWRYTKIDPH